MKKMRIILLSVCMVLLGLPSLGQTNELPIFYEGIRPLGMGGAFTAVADDENALFYNPAGLYNEKRKGFRRFDILKPSLELSNSIFEFIKDAQGIQDSSGAAQFDKTTDLVNKWIGKGLHMKMSALTDLIYHRFGMGLLTQASIGAAVHNPFSSQTLELKFTGDAALLVSGAKKVTLWKEQTLLIGVTAKAINRQQVDLAYSIREISESKFDPLNDLNPEIGFALDLGALYPLPGRSSKPVIGISLQNIVGGDLGTAGELPMQINLGTSFRPTVGHQTVLLAADIMDITNNIGTDNDLAKRLHLGLEYKLPWILTLRSGLYQGYPSGGFTLNLRLAKLDYAYHVEELGAYSGQKPDPRHALQLSVGLQ
jgi:hypothetical protein